MSQCDDDPTLTEMLGDPLVGSVMAAYGVDREKLALSLEEIARTLASHKSLPRRMRQVPNGERHAGRACLCA